ncbi:MAG: hypothetical protein LBD42_02925 [Desulfovibrio sp.]|jgi:hypothetical protein|nr:hypothetical protein [Desulfovibrio sp.]
MTLSDIQQSFYSRSFDIEAVETWFLGLGIVIAAIAIYLTIMAIKARRLRYFPHGSITDARIIQKVIRQAFDQRRSFEVQIRMSSGQRRPTLRCAPEYIGKTSFTVEISGLKSLSDKWLGREIAVFFRIQIDKEFTYYTFASHIDGIHHPQPGICHITLPLPTSLENRQKRSFLRMAPPQEFLMGAALWHGDCLPSPQYLSDVTLWPRPRLLLIPERMDQFRILDLSAGGMRLSVPSKIVRTQQLHFTSSDQFITMLDLFDPENNKRLRFWMQCRAQNVWLEHGTHDVHMGLQFQSWARPKEEDKLEHSNGVEWLRLSATQEVEPIGNWIMRRHLEIFRETPAEALE